MADKLSRHPSQYQSSSIEAEEMFKKWFTTKVVKKVTPKLHEPGKAKTQKIRIQKNEARNELLMVHALTHVLNKS